MNLHPLTHHEILALLAPYARQGRQVDLAASDRLARRLAFKPRLQDDGLQEGLMLEQAEAGRWLLTRTLQRDGGPEATVQARGSDPAELLSRIEAVMPATLFATGPGWALACSHRVDTGAAGPQAMLSRVTARLAGLQLLVTLPAVRGYPAEVAVVPDAETRFELPDDLLAVLGRDWSQLRRIGGRWTGTLRLRGRGPARGQQVPAQWAAAAAHVARTLAEPPAQFHQRLAGARWRVAFRRSLPMLWGLAGIGAALAVPTLAIGQDSPLRMLVFNAPPLLLALGVSLKELPRFELPRPPRVYKLAAWRQAG